MSARAELLRACAFSDIDCLDQRVLFPLPPQSRPSLPRTSVPWPNERHSCDFCGTYAAAMCRCDSCQRWLGLSDCECAEPARRRTAAWPAGGDRFVVVDDHSGRCRWCAKDESAPTSCGRSMGLLRRIVFVLEPTPSAGWRFQVAQRLLVALLENTDAGSVLLYSFECGDDGQGFDVPTHSALEGHFGLRGMAERAMRMGATLSIDSAPGRGTRVRVVMPG
jgi:hypothetical protein